jgi:hypothetical protein
MVESDVPGSTPGSNHPRGWLIFFGTVEILIGGVAALLSLFTLVFFLYVESLGFFRQEPGNTLALAFSACFYGAIALFFVATGVGTIRKRPWARILMLVASSLWLALGLLTILVLLFLWPTLNRGISEKDPTISGGVMFFTLVLIGGILFILHILFPASFLFFYTRKSVKAAFAQGDLGEPMSLGRPLPLLALCAWVAVCALSTLLGLMFNVQAVFAIILTGTSAFALTLALAGVQGWLARGLYRLEPRAWWGTLVFYFLMGISGFVTFYRIPMAVLAEKMGFDFTGQQGTEQMMSAIQSSMPALMMVGNLLLLSLILFVKRYFRSKGPSPGLPAIG